MDKLDIIERIKPKTYNVFKQKYSDIPKVKREVISTQRFWFSFILKSDVSIIVQLINKRQTPSTSRIAIQI